VRQMLERSYPKRRTERRISAKCQIGRQNRDTRKGTKCWDSKGGIREESRSAQSRFF